MGLHAARIQRRIVAALCTGAKRHRRKREKEREKEIARKGEKERQREEEGIWMHKRERGASLETHCPVWKLFHVESADGPKTLSAVDSNRREDVDDRNMLMTAEEAKRRESTSKES